MIIIQMDDKRDLFNLATAFPQQFYTMALARYFQIHKVSSSTPQGVRALQLSFVYDYFRHSPHFYVDTMQWLSMYPNLKSLRIKVYSPWHPYDDGHRDSYNWEIRMAEMAEVRLCAPLGLI